VCVEGMEGRKEAMKERRMEFKKGRNTRNEEEE
jgi:hypothetical protein